MTERRDRRTLHQVVRDALMEGLEEAARLERTAPDNEELQEAREIAEYAMDLLQPATEAFERGDYLDCFRHLDTVAVDVAGLGLGRFVKIPAEYAARVSRGSPQADLIRGWADRAVGYVHLAEGKLGDARRRFRRALGHGKSAQDATLVGAALLSIGYTHQEQGQEAKAREAYEEALPHARRSDEPWLLAHVTTNLGALVMHEDPATAEELFEESLRARAAEPGGLSAAPVLTNMGILRSEQGRFSEAEKLYREALQHAGGAVPEEAIDHRDVVIPMQNLAAALTDQRRFSEAAEVYEEAIEVAEGVGDLRREGELRRGLAVCLANAGDFERSHEQFTLLLESAERFGLRKDVAAMVVRDLGVTAAQTGRPGEAVERFRSARGRYEALGDRAGVAGTLLDEAGAQDPKDLEAQEGLIRGALEALKRTRHNETKLVAYDRLVRVLFEQRRIEDALGVFREERRLLRRLGRDRALARRLAEVASILASFRLGSEAARVMRQSVGLYEEIGDDIGYAQSRNDLANQLLRLGREREAEDIYLDNLESARRAENRVLEAEALQNLGELRRREGRTQEAIATLRESADLNRGLNDLGSLSLNLNNLGLALEQAGEVAAARRSFEESLRVASEIDDDAAAARALGSLGGSAFDRGEIARSEEMYQKAVDHAARGGERGLEAQMLFNLAIAAHRARGTSEAEALAERTVEKAQDALHYDTAYEVSAAMVEWLVLDRDLEEAGEWSAYALLFGPLLSGGVGRWADWIVDVLRSVPEVQDRCRFLDAMQERCRSIEEENDVGGQLLRGVEMLRSRMG